MVLLFDIVSVQRQDPMNLAISDFKIQFYKKYRREPKAALVNLVTEQIKDVSAWLKKNNIMLTPQQLVRVALALDNNPIGALDISRIRHDITKISQLFWEKSKFNPDNSSEYGIKVTPLEIWQLANKMNPKNPGKALSWLISTFELIEKRYLEKSQEYNTRIEMGNYAADLRAHRETASIVRNLMRTLNMHSGRISTCKTIETYKDLVNVLLEQALKEYRH